MSFNREEFFTEVYEIVREIPAGKVLTYGHIARLTGKPQYARQVGKAMSNAPISLNLPCHRVVNSQGHTAPGWSEQQELLENEGIVFNKAGCVNLKKYLWTLL